MIFFFDSWYSYTQLLDMLHKYEFPRHYEVEWISYICLLAIENASHLEYS